MAKQAKPYPGKFGPTRAQAQTANLFVGVLEPRWELERIVNLARRPHATTPARPLDLSFEVVDPVESTSQPLPSQ